MRYSMLDEEQTAVIEKALAYANLRRPRAREDRESWAADVKRITGVVGPTTHRRGNGKIAHTRYTIDQAGRLKGTREANLLASAALRWQTRLRAGLRELHLGDAPRLPDSRVLTIKNGKGEKVGIRFDWSATSAVWVIQRMVYQNKIVPTEMRVITPTLQAFVAYSIHLLTQKKWRRRLSQCVICDRYFLSPQRGGGRRTKTCGDACKETHEKRIGAKRQQKSRDRRTIRRA
jgi:hypothetical protein